MRSLLLRLVFCLTPATGVLAQPLLPLFDARVSPEPPGPGASERALLEAEVRPAARGYWQDDASCAEDFRVVGVARGAFTRPGVDEQAVLYTFCMVGHGFERNGLVVLEGGVVVLHLAYEGGGESDLAAWPDVNENGLAELVVVRGATNMGSTVETIEVIELPEGEAASHGMLETYGDACGSGLEEAPALAYRILAEPGPAPVLYREAYRRACEGEAWTRTAGAERVALDKDASVPDFHRLK